MASQKSCQASAAKASRRDIRRSARRDFQLKKSTAVVLLPGSTSVLIKLDTEPHTVGRIKTYQDWMQAFSRRRAEDASLRSGVGPRAERCRREGLCRFRDGNQRTVATSDLRDNWSLLFDPDGTSCRLEALFRRDQRIGTQRWTHARHTIDFISLF
jgi:hypothetical protein